MLKRYKFTNKEQEAFFPELKRRVDKVLAENGRTKYGGWRAIAKAIFFITGFYTCYGLLVADFLPATSMLVLSGLMGFFAACIGFNVGHDAIHGTISKDNRVNKFFTLFFDLQGANSWVWNIGHNIVHHTHTNIDGADEDLDAGMVVRLSPASEWRPHHRFQHIYAFALYSLASINWVFVKDYKKFYQQYIGSYKMPKPPIKEVYRLYGFKAFYYLMFLVVPIIAIDSVAWYWVIAGFFISHLVEGLTLALVFQLAHTVEMASFPEPDENGAFENSWAVHQMNTTANFACDSKAAAFFLGGLNFQVEHHLFASISHVHYPLIRTVVKQTAEDFGIPYLEQDTFAGAMASHFRFLKEMGKEPVFKPEPVLVEN